MPGNDVTCRAKQAAKQGKAPTTQAGEFVRKEIEHIRSGVPDARPAKQAFAIGMSRGHRYVSSILLAVALFSPLVFSGCAVRASYRVYDPDHADYHVWDGNEVVYYQRWEVETPATIESSKSDTPMSSRNTGPGGTIITMISARNYATGSLAIPGFAQGKTNRDTSASLQHLLPWLRMLLPQRARSSQA